MDNRKKPSPDFVIRMVGPGIKPWAVPMRSLAKALDAVQRLVEQQEKTDDEIIHQAVETPEEEAREADEFKEEITAGQSGALRLIGITSRSAGYGVAATNREPTIQRIRLTGEALGAPDSAEWTTATLSSIRDLSEIARALGCQIELREPGKGLVYGNILAKIGPTTYDGIRGSAYVTGKTSVYARIERVGGATDMHCGIRVSGQPSRMVICRVDGEELVRDLGQYIYQDVFLHGIATWLRHNLLIYKFEITAFDRPRTGSVLDGLNRIREASRGAWDGIPNPDLYIAEMRRT